MSVLENIQKGVYRPATDNAVRQMREDLALEFKLTGDQEKMVWRKAWDNGCDIGLQKVYEIYRKTAELIL